eukprot:scaffold7397_cov108-Isochrysis_galbana.AAC.4
MPPPRRTQPPQQPRVGLSRQPQLQQERSRRSPRQQEMSKQELSKEELSKHELSKQELNRRPQPPPPPELVRPSLPSAGCACAHVPAGEPAGRGCRFACGSGARPVLSAPRRGGKEPRIPRGPGTEAHRRQRSRPRPRPSQPPQRDGQRRRARSGSDRPPLRPGHSRLSPCPRGALRGSPPPRQAGRDAVHTHRSHPRQAGRGAVHTGRSHPSRRTRRRPGPRRPPRRGWHLRR